MAEKSFRTPSGTVESAEITADYNNAEKFEQVKIGNLGVYYRSGFSVHFLPYSSMERVFIRIHEVNGRLCCGNTTFSYYKLVFVCGGKEIADIISENEKLMDAALARIHELAPEIPVGVEE